MAEHDMRRREVEEKQRNKSKALKIEREQERESSKTRPEVLQGPVEFGYQEGWLEAHPGMITDSRLSSPANAGQKGRAVTGLQLKHGNSYVQRLLASGRVQAKMAVSAPDDKYEVEADKTSREVVRSIHRQEEEEVQLKRIQRAGGPEEEEPLQGKLVMCQAEEEEEEVQTKRLMRKGGEDEEEPLQGKLLRQEEEEVQLKRIQRAGGPEEEEPLQGKLVMRQAEEEEEEVQAKRLQRQEEEEEVQTKRLMRRGGEDEEEPLQGKGAAATPEVSPDLERDIEQAKGSGASLPADIRTKMESAFDTNFSGVRVHDDAKSSRMAGEVQAVAFTTGSDIFFRQGAYSPGSDAGKELLAHELTHVVQQTGRVARVEAPAMDKGGDEAKGEAQRRIWREMVLVPLLDAGWALKGPKPDCARAIEKCLLAKQRAADLSVSLDTDPLIKSDIKDLIKSIDGVVERIRSASKNPEAAKGLAAEVGGIDTLANLIGGKLWKSQAEGKGAGPKAGGPKAAKAGKK